MFLYREYGAVYMISVLAIVWVADITAYFGGRALQGPKMATGISPKKHGLELSPQLFVFLF